MLESIKFSHITKRFKAGNSLITVLDGIDVLFQRNSRYSIIGSSGSGKSTLLYILTGFEEPSTGTVYFNDRDRSTFDSKEKQRILRRSLGLVFQAPYLLNELSVVENVMIKGLIEGQPYQTSFNHALELLDMVGLSTRVYASPATLSGGEQQRVAISRALFNKPQFLIADEPTAHLDQMTGRHIIDLLCTCQSMWNMGLIIASHDPYITYKSDYVLKLEQGTLFQTTAKPTVAELHY
jgi:ABC-type lipoprotein export system ATPase subunit